jgi:macrolide-specific efflux system membrane fusion protein
MLEFKTQCIAVVCLWGLLGAAVQAAEPPTVSVLVNVLDQVEISPREPGVLVAIAAREGRQVKLGDTLAQIDDADEQYQLARVKVEVEIAAKKATSELDVLIARKTMEVAQALYRRAREAEAKFPNSIPQTDLEQLGLEAEKSELAVRHAEHEQAIARLEHDLKTTELEFAGQRVERRKIKAPFDGMVVELNSRSGEWVQPGDKVIRMIRLDRLRVEGFIDALTARRGLEGSPVRLNVQVPDRPAMQYKGELVFVSPEVDPVNNQVRVCADIENPDLSLRPGIRGTLIIDSSDAG